MFLSDNRFEGIPNGLHSLSSMEMLCLSNQNKADFQLHAPLLPLISLPRLQHLRLYRGVRFPRWSIRSYWHIGEALRAIRTSGAKTLQLGFTSVHGDKEDEVVDAIEDEDEEDFELEHEHEDSD